MSTKAVGPAGPCESSDPFTAGRRTDEAVVGQAGQVVERGAGGFSRPSSGSDRRRRELALNGADALVSGVSQAAKRKADMHFRLRELGDGQGAKQGRFRLLPSGGDQQHRSRVDFTEGMDHGQRHGQQRRAERVYAAVQYGERRAVRVDHRHGATRARRTTPILAADRAGTPAASPGPPPESCDTDHPVPGTPAPRSRLKCPPGSEQQPPLSILLAWSTSESATGPLWT
jgi:hypothetical protein